MLPGILKMLFLIFWYTRSQKLSVDTSSMLDLYFCYMLNVLVHVNNFEKFKFFSIDKKTCWWNQLCGFSCTCKNNSWSGIQWQKRPEFFQKKHVLFQLTCLV